MAKILNLWLVIEDDDGETQILKNSDPFFFAASNTCRDRAVLEDDSEFEVMTAKGTETFTLLFKSSEKADCEQFLEEVYENEGGEENSDEEEDDAADLWFVVQFPDNTMEIKQNSDQEFFAKSKKTMKERAQLPMQTELEFPCSCHCGDPVYFKLCFSSMKHEECVGYKNTCSQLSSLHYLINVDSEIEEFEDVTTVNLKTLNNVVCHCLKVLVPCSHSIVVGVIDKYGRLDIYSAEFNKIKNKRNPSIHDLFSRCFFEERFDPALSKDLLKTHHDVLLWKYNKSKGVKETVVGKEFNKKNTYIMFVTKKEFIEEKNGQTLFKLEYPDFIQETYKGTIEIQKLIIAQLISARNAEEDD